MNNPTARFNALMRLKGKRFVIRHMRSGRTIHCTVRAESLIDRTIDAGRSAASFRLPHERRAEI